jgi:hypothetical protein
MPTNLNLTAADRILFASGTFTGSVNNSGGTICVALGAAFNPANINGTSRVFVRGTATLPALAAGSGALLDNEGTVTFLAQPNTNGIADVFNRAGATIVIQAGVALSSGTTVINDGTIDVQGGANLNGSTVTNNGTLTIAGAFNIVGTVTNTGHAAVGGLLTVNSGGAVINSCSLGAAGLINNATVTNDGVIDLDSQALLINGSGSYTQSAAAITLGNNFTNNGSVTGTGQYLFTGTTTTQGTVAGTAGAPIIFFDTTPTGAQIFDVQSGTITNTVRQTVVAPPAGACNTNPVPPTTTTTTTTTPTTTTSTTTTTTPTTTTTTPTTTTTTTTPTTTGPTSPTTSTPTTAAPSSTSSAVTSTPTTAPRPTDPQIEPTSSSIRLPATGSSGTGALLVLAVVALVAGLAALAMSRFAPDRHEPS